MVALDFCQSAELDDLKQVGCIGLMKAVRRFRPELGNAFSSFAIPYIRGEIQHYLRDRIPLIRPPRGKRPETVLRLDVRVGIGEVATLADIIEGRAQPNAISELYEAIDTLEPPLQEVIWLHLEGFNQFAEFPSRRCGGDG
jgi:RNA polymerase sigma-B factor